MMFYVKNTLGLPMRRETITDRAVWSFETKNFLVAFEPEPEDMDPGDCLDSPEDVEFARWTFDPAAWFCAVVTVYAKRIDGSLAYLASDVLGGCSYRSFEEFVASHRDRDPMNRNCSIMRAARGENVVMCDYFPSMVREAVRKTREELRRGCSIYIRGAA